MDKSQSMKNIQKLAKMLDGQQLVTTEEFRSAVSDFINAFAQHRSAFGEISKKNEETMAIALQNLQAEFEAIRGEVKNETGMTKEEMKSMMTKCMADMKSMCDEMESRLPKDGEDGLDADEEKIIQEVLAKIKTETPQQTTPNEEIDKINLATNQIQKERVQGLDQAILNSAQNAVASLPATTTFINGKRAKNLNFSGATVNVVGDTADIAITASGTGTVTSVAALTIGTTGTDLSSTVANGTTTPVITLQVPTASATNRGALSAADWSTFNSKAPALGADDNYVTDAEKIVIGNTSGTNSGNQTITNSSDATSHTVTLSASGGSVQFVEGSNITLTTTGTGPAGVVTIASTASSGAGNAYGWFIS